MEDSFVTLTNTIKMMIDKTKNRVLTAVLALCSQAVLAQTNQLFDDGWQFLQNGKTVSVNLPHDWDIYTAPDAPKGATGTDGGWYQGGKGEYRKTFATPEGEVVKLHFEGVYQSPDSPYLYAAKVELKESGTVIDEQTVRYRARCQLPGSVFNKPSDLCPSCRSVFYAEKKE